MKRIKLKLLSLQSSVLLLALAGSYPASAQWTGIDVGAPTPAGTLTQNADGSTTISAGGADIWLVKDALPVASRLTIAALVRA